MVSQSWQARQWNRKAIAFTKKIWSQQDNGIAKLALRFLYFGSWIPNDYRKDCSFEIPAFCNSLSYKFIVIILPQCKQYVLALSARTTC